MQNEQFGIVVILTSPSTHGGITQDGKLILARLHTAVSSGPEYSITSQHKFDDLIVGYREDKPFQPTKPHFDLVIDDKAKRIEEIGDFELSQLKENK